MKASTKTLEGWRIITKEDDCDVVADYWYELLPDYPNQLHTKKSLKRQLTVYD